MNIADLQALELISRLPDDVYLTTGEAAVFLRVSASTLNKMRRPGYPTPGPVYSQGGRRGSGDNQKILYKKADLLAWLEANRISDTHAAAVRKGRYDSFSTLADVAEPAAFWRTPDGLLGGLVEETGVDLFFERLGKWDIEWLAPADAARDQWNGGSEHRALAAAVSDVLRKTLSAVAAAVEAGAIGEVVRDGSILEKGEAAKPFKRT